jgi:hypothetical protein
LGVRKDPPTLFQSTAHDSHRTLSAFPLDGRVWLASLERKCGVNALAVVPDVQLQNATGDDFQQIVEELRAVKLRGDEAVRDAVVIINEYQAKFGDSKDALKRLAHAVGVEVSTLYRWKAQVEGNKRKNKKTTPTNVEPLKAAFHNVSEIHKSLIPSPSPKSVFSSASVLSLAALLEYMKSRPTLTDREQEKYIFLIATLGQISRQAAEWARELSEVKL